jgi:hypothetical protein
MKNIKNLFDSTWALIGHELAATKDLSKGLVLRGDYSKYPDLDQRIQVFKEIGLSN